MINETDEKFVEWVEQMLYFSCGFDYKRGHKILVECLKLNKEKKKWEKEEKG